MPRFAPDTWLARFIQATHRMRNAHEMAENGNPCSPAELHYCRVAVEEHARLMDEACEAEHRWANDERRVA